MRLWFSKRSQTGTVKGKGIGKGISTGAKAYGGIKKGAFWMQNSCEKGYNKAKKSIGKKWTKFKQ